MAGNVGVGLSVLVVDDDEVMRELLSALLDAAGDSVLTAEDSAAALAILQSEAGRLDVVLTDLRMPNTEASDLLLKLRKAMPAESRLLGMSGNAPETAELELLDGFLLKPFSVEEFAAAVERARAGAPQSSPAVVTRAHGTSPVLDAKIFEQMTRMLPVTALRELYELTLEDVRKRTEAIRAGAAAGDAGVCKSEAHAMKGGCGMVGAMELRAIAADIETGSPIDTSTLKEIAAATERLRRMLDTLT